MVNSDSGSGGVKDLWVRFECVDPPLLARVPLNEEPVQHQGQHGHEAQIEPVIELRSLCAGLTHLLQVSTLATRTNLAGRKKVEDMTNSQFVQKLPMQYLNRSGRKTTLPNQDFSSSMWAKM